MTFWIAELKISSNIAGMKNEPFASWNFANVHFLILSLRQKTSFIGRILRIEKKRELWYDYRYGKRGAARWSGRYGLFRYKNSALIAQGIEQRFPKPCVGCSNHLRGAIRKAPAYAGAFCLFTYSTWFFKGFLIVFVCLSWYALSRRNSLFLGRRRFWCYGTDEWF